MIGQWQMYPYYQVFCGETVFQTSSLRFLVTALNWLSFANALARQVQKQLLGLSIALHGGASEEATVLVDTTVQEKAITYPTDSKLAINLLMAACAWNLRKWMIAFFLFEIKGVL